MYKIGEFALITKTSKRMLRYYDEKGLLTPDKDDKTGYRFYLDDDISTMNMIRKLHRYKFSVEEMKEVLAKGISDRDEIYTKKINDLNDEKERYTDIINELYDEISRSSSMSIRNQYEVSIGIHRSYAALSLRKKVKSKDLESFIDLFFQRIGNIKHVRYGKYVVIYHEIYEEEDELLDVEICQPITDKPEYEIKGIEYKVFDETNCVRTIHIGDYSQISFAYSSLYNWTLANGYSICGPYIERYYTDEYVTSNRDEFITEVLVSVIKTWPSHDVKV